MNKKTLITQFCTTLPVEYHAESLERLRHVDPTSFRNAAVLIGFVERDNGLNIILTKRADHLRHHPGQISFPGGKYEDSDGHLKNTATREAWEEIGLNPSLIDIFGQLPPLITFSRFNVTPILAWVDHHYETTIDPNEVASVFEVPANHLLDIEQLYSQRFLFKQYSHRVFAIPYKEHFVWGVTAQIIQALQLQINFDN